MEDHLSVQEDDGGFKATDTRMSGVIGTGATADLARDDLAARVLKSIESREEQLIGLVQLGELLGEAAVLVLVFVPIETVKGIQWVSGAGFVKQNYTQLALVTGTLVLSRVLFYWSVKLKRRAFRIGQKLEKQKKIHRSIELWRD